MQTTVKSPSPDNARAAAARRIVGRLEAYRLGATDVPVRIDDLTPDGCLVEIGFGTLSGKVTRLQIDLPGEGWIIVRCETLHIAGLNAFAVKFLRLDDDTRSRIALALDRLGDRPPEDGASAINREAIDD